MSAAQHKHRSRKVAGMRTTPRPGPGAQPDHAWKALGLVNDWIRHSDSKAGVTLAFVGVLGTVTFNLATRCDERSPAFDTLVVLSSALLLAAAALCGVTLTPRVDDKEADTEVINRLFFKSITKHFKGNRDGYAEVLHTLTADPRELIRDLAHQIHANARIATIKARYATWAIRSALAAGVAVACLAIVVGLTNT